MFPLILAAALSFGICLVLTPVIRTLARRWNFVDRPDAIRKLHARPIPVAGGIALFISVVCTLSVLLVAPTALRDELHSQLLNMACLLGGGIVICLVGVADDYWTLRGWVKLLGQLAAIAVVMSSGLLVRHLRLFEVQVELGVFGVPVTVFLLLGAVNSLNLIDGMDGLLSTVGMIIALAIGVMAVWTGHAAQAAVAVALAGGLLAFLRYNFPPASIFLGDSGSMLIGLTVGVLAIRCSLKASATLALGFPLAALALPFFDTSMAVLRRKLTGRSLYASDRGHLHHCLQRRGLSNRAVLLLVAAGASVTAIAALASLVVQNDLLAVATVVVIVCLFIATGMFGHAELLLVKKRLGAILAYRLGKSPKGVYQVQVRLQGCLKWEELWARLTRCAGQLNLEYLCLDVNAPSLHEGYFARWQRARRGRDAANKWHGEFPLSPHGPSLGSLKLGGNGSSDALLEALTRLTTIVEKFTESNRLALVGAADTAAKNGLDAALSSANHAANNGTARADPPQKNLRRLHLPATSASRPTG